MTINELYKSDVSNLQISKDLLMSIISKYIKQYKLQDEIKDIDFNAKLPSYQVGMYCSDKKLIRLKLDSYNDSVKTNPEKYAPKDVLAHGEQYTFDYLLLKYIRVLYHELAHAKQHHEYNTNQMPMDLFLMTLHSLSKDYDKYYRKYHDIYPTEHNANVESINSLSNLRVSSLVDAKRFNTMAVSYLIDNYQLNDSDFPNITITAPTEQFYKVIGKDMPNIANYDLYTRLSYGLPISMGELMDIDELSTSPDKIKNIQKTLSR